MIVNKFIQFISRTYKGLCYKCQSVFKITHLIRSVILPALIINFELFRKHLACFATPRTAQDTSKSLRMKETLVDAPHKAVEKA